MKHENEIIHALLFDFVGLKRHHGPIIDGGFEPAWGNCTRGGTGRVFL